MAFAVVSKSSPIAVQYTSTITGYSSAPTQSVSQYWLMGTLCIYVLSTAGATSNATTTTFTIPFPADKGFIQANGVGSNNGSALTTTMRFDTAAGTNVVSVFRDGAATAWTASGTKNFRVVLIYEIEN